MKIRFITQICVYVDQICRIEKGIVANMARRYLSTFKRYEKKYLLKPEQYTILNELIKGKLSVDKYGQSTICNIYFDTPNHQLIRESLEKPAYKEKLRLRSYGVPSEGDPVFIELKKKYKGIVYKRRESLDLLRAELYLYDNNHDNHHIKENSQVMKEINWFLQFYDEIIPSMYIAYDRIALYGVDDSELRVTFDSNIRWREEELYLGCGDWGNQLMDDSMTLMEIKTPYTMPLWLSHLLDELEIYPVSFSKYGIGYQQAGQLKKGLANKEFITNTINEEGDFVYA